MLTKMLIQGLVAAAFIAGAAAVYAQSSGDSFPNQPAYEAESARNGIQIAPQTALQSGMANAGGNGYLSAPRPRSGEGREGFSFQGLWGGEHHDDDHRGRHHDDD